MGLEINKLLGARKAWHAFRRNHPQLRTFIAGLKQRGIPEGSQVAAVFTFPDGDVRQTAFSVRESDLELLDLILSLLG